MISTMSPTLQNSIVRTPACFSPRSLDIPYLEALGVSLVLSQVCRQIDHTLLLEVAGEGILRSSLAATPPIDSLIGLTYASAAPKTARVTHLYCSRGLLLVAVSSGIGVGRSVSVKPGNCSLAGCDREKCQTLMPRLQFPGLTDTERPQQLLCDSSNCVD